MAKSKFEQYMLLGVGIMVAIGFSGMFTYSNLANSSNTPSTDKGEIKAELPSKNYIEGSFNLSIAQQAYLASNENIVFVNAFYKNNTAQYQGIESLTTEFDNKVYINTINRSESTIGSNYKLDVPSTLIVGGQPTRRTPYSLRTAGTNKTSVKKGICGAMKDVGEFGATCYTS